MCSSWQTKYFQERYLYTAQHHDRPGDRHVIPAWVNFNHVSSHTLSYGEHHKSQFLEGSVCRTHIRNQELSCIHSSR